MLRNILHYTNIFGFLWTLCVCLFGIVLPRWVQFTGIYIFFFTWLIEVFWEKRWQHFPSRSWLYYALQIALFLLAFCYWPWDGEVYFHHHVEQRIPLLAFGIYGLLGINHRFTRATIIHTMMIVSIGSIVFLLAKTGLHEVLFNPNRVSLLASNRIRFINAHMGYDFYLNSTLIGIWYLLFHADRKPALWQRILYPLSAALIFSMLLLSDGRSGFFMGIVNVGLMIVIECYRFSKKAGIAVATAALAFIVTFSALHPRISKEHLAYDLRYSYWKAAVELIEEKPVLGYGVSTAQEEFDKVNMKYVDENDPYFWSVSRTHYIDCHNQFLQSSLEFGILGLVIVLAIYLMPLYICWGKREWWLALFFTLISLGQSLFDMFLTGRFNILYGLLFLMTLWVTKDYATPILPSSSATNPEGYTD